MGVGGGDPLIGERGGIGGRCLGGAKFAKQAHQLDAR